MKKLLLVPLLVLLAAAGGCIVAGDDGPHRVHSHCVGCGHVFVRGGWR